MRDLRVERGLTQRQLAELAGVLTAPTDSALVRVGPVGDRLMCVPTSGSGEGWAAADAVARDGAVETLEVERPAVVIGLAVRLLGSAAGPRVVHVATSIATAIAVLAPGRCHAIVVHGPARTLPRSPVPVQRWRVARGQVGPAAADPTPGWIQWP